MKNAISLTVYESEILKSLANKTEEEVFSFINKILNRQSYPTESAARLQKHLEDYILNYQTVIWNDEHLQYVDDGGNLCGKYAEKPKKPRLNKKPKREAEPNDKIEPTA